MAQAFYPLPNCRAGNPDGGSLHELAAPKMHSRRVTTPLVGSYPTFSPFQSIRAPNHAIKNRHKTVVIFFCIAQPSRTASTLGSGMPCAARTFLLPLSIIYSDSATDRPTAFISQSCHKVSVFISNDNTLMYNIRFCWQKKLCITNEDRECLMWMLDSNKTQIVGRID